MELIRNDKLFIHLQRPHLIEVYCAFRSDFRYATLGTIEVLLLRSYLIILNLKLYVKHQMS